MQIDSSTGVVTVAKSWQDRTDSDQIYDITVRGTESQCGQISEATATVTFYRPPVDEGEGEVRPADPNPDDGRVVDLTWCPDCTPPTYISGGNPHPILHFDIDVPATGTPAYYEATLAVGGTTVISNRQFNIVSGMEGLTARMALQFDASGLSTGYHDYTLTLAAKDSSGATLSTHTLDDRVGFANYADSEYGNRRWLSFLDQLDIDEASSGGVGLIRGDGTHEFFVGTGGTYASPNDVFEILTKTAIGYTLESSAGWTKHFDAAGLLTQVTDRNGRVLQSFTYTDADADGLVDELATFTQADGHTATYTYTNGRLSSSTNGRGQTYSYVYNADGTLKETTALPAVAGGPTPKISYTYDPVTKLMLTKTDVKGLVTTFTYGSDHRVRSIDRPGTGVETISPSQSVGLDGLVLLEDIVSSSSIGSTAWTRIIDSLGNVTEATDANGHTVEYVRDGRGLVLEMIAPNPDDPNTPLVTHYEYNSRGKLTKVTHADGTWRQYTYAAGGLDVLSERDEAGKLWTYTVDAAGNRLTATDPLGETTTYTYDARGNLLTITAPDPDGAGPLAAPVTTYAYDAHDRVIEVTNPDLTVRTYTYDPVTGNVATETDERGHTTSYTYDAYGRVLTVTLPDPDGAGPQDAPVWTYVWCACGSLKSETDPLGNTTTYEYDETTGLLESVTTADPDGAGPLTPLTTTYGYDALGRMVTETAPGGRVTAYEYDGNGNVIKITEPDPDGAGPQAAPVWEYGYDALNRLVWVKDPTGSVAAGTITEYDYDSVGLLTKVTDPTGYESTFAYDDAGRLISETGPLQNGSGATAPQTQYEYDDAGRLTQVTDPLGNETTYAYDGLGRLTVVTNALGRTQTTAYDEVGRVTTVTESGGTQTFTYEAETDLNHVIGRADADGWSANVAQDTVGFLAFGPFVDNLPLGELVASFRLMIDSVAAGNPDDRIATIEVVGTGGDVLVRRTLQRGEFTAAFLYQDFRLSFRNTPGQVLQFRTFWHDVAYLRLDRVDVVAGATGERLFEAETELNHHVGQVSAEGDAWEARVAFHDAGWMAFGPYATDVPEGRQEAAFRLWTDNNTLNNAVLARIEVHDATTLRVLASQVIRRGDFRAAAAWQDFVLAYDQAAGHAIQFRVFWFDAGWMKLDRVSVTQRPATVFQGADDFLHNTGAAEGDAWGARVQLHDAGYLAYGPYVDDLAPGRNVAAFRLAVGSTTNGTPQDLVARIDVQDIDAGQVLTSLVLRRGDFAAGGVAQEFALSFVAVAGHRIEFRTFWYDVVRTRLDRVVVTALDPLPTAPELVTRYSYDDAGNLTSVTDPLGNTTNWTYDALNRVTSETDPRNETTNYTYDAAGRLTALVDASVNVTTWVHDALGRVIEEIDPRSSSRLFVYDAAGDLAQRTDRNGRVSEFDFDDLGRLVAERWLDPLGATLETLTWSYDAAGRTTTAADGDSSLAFSYDAAGRLLTAGTSGTAAVASLLTSTYDDLGRRETLAVSAGGAADFLNTWTYDLAGRLTQVTQTGQTGGRAVADKRVDLDYDALGRRTAIDRYADLAGTQFVATSRYGYDAAGRLTDLHHRQGTTALAEYGWSYDAAGRLIRETASAGTTSYQYDTDGQLTNVAYADPTRGDETYTYDPTGNRTGGSHQTAPGNRLVEDAAYTYQYDDEGNLTRETKKSDASYRTFEWDHRNRLIEVEARTSAGTLVWTVAYDYDVHNRLIRRQADANGDGTFDEAQAFVHDGTRAILVFDDADSVTNRLLWGPAIDELFADEDALNEILWGLTDRLGTVRDVVEHDAATGTTSVVNHLEYDAFGEVVSETNPAKTPLFRFTGRYTDPLTGDQWNWHRWYNGRTGRWRSQDPIGFDGGDANLYRYVGNGPTNYVDPSGRMPNQANMIDFINLLNAIDTIERDYPGETPLQHLGRLRDALKRDGPGGKNRFRDGTKIPYPGIRSPLSRNGEGDGWAYMCTETDGYIDLPHFIEAAEIAAYGVPPALVEFGGKVIEHQQSKDTTGAPGTRSSAKTPEDEPSNALGANFGGSFKTDAPLSTQCINFFLPRRPIPFKLAPGFGELPTNEADWENIFQTDPTHAKDLFDLVRRARPVEAVRP